MADTQLMQAILDGQNLLRHDLKRLEEKLDRKLEEIGQRIDRLGMQMASLEDDAPTSGEFGLLEKRVDKLEERFAST